MEETNKDKDFSKLFHIIVDSGIWARLSYKAQAVYAVLQRDADYVTRIAHTSEIKIAKLSGVTRDSVSAAIKELRIAGLISVKRCGPRMEYKNMYKIHKEPIFNSAVLATCITREKTGKCNTCRDPKTKKFIKGPKNTVERLRENTDESGILRKNTGSNEIIEIPNIDITGSASACPNSQAEPVSPLLNGLIGQTIDFNTAKWLIERRGDMAVALIRSDKIKLLKGVDLDEVIKSVKSDKSKMS